MCVVVLIEHELSSHSTPQRVADRAADMHEHHRCTWALSVSGALVVSQRKAEHTHIKLKTGATS